MSSSTAIFWPMIAQVVLVYSIYYIMFRKRVAAIKAGKARASQFRENQNEPEQSLFARNNLSNQFELPVLFFAVCLAIYVTGSASVYPVLLAWAFVATRVAHSWVHISTNRIRQRMPIWTAGYLINGLLWLWLAVNITVN